MKKTKTAPQLTPKTETTKKGSKLKPTASKPPEPVQPLKLKRKRLSRFMAKIAATERLMIDLGLMVEKVFYGHGVEFAIYLPSARTARKAALEAVGHHGLRYVQHQLSGFIRMGVFRINREYKLTLCWIDKTTYLRKGTRIQQFRDARAFLDELAIKYKATHVVVAPTELEVLYGERPPTDALRIMTDFGMHPTNPHL